MFDYVLALYGLVCVGSTEKQVSLFHWLVTLESPDSFSEGRSLRLLDYSHRLEWASASRCICWFIFQDASGTAVSLLMMMVWSFCSWNCSNSCIRERAFLQSDLHYNFAWLHHLEFAETMLLLSQAVAPLYMADPDIGHCWLSGSKILSMATTTQHSSKCRWFGWTAARVCFFVFDYFFALLLLFLK